MGEGERCYQFGVGLSDLVSHRTKQPSEQRILQQLHGTLIGSADFIWKFKGFNTRVWRMLRSMRVGQKFGNLQRCPFVWHRKAARLNIRLVTSGQRGSELDKAISPHSFQRQGHLQTAIGTIQSERTGQF